MQQIPRVHFELPYRGQPRVWQDPAERHPILPGDIRAINHETPLWVFLCRLDNSTATIVTYTGKIETN